MADWNKSVVVRQGNNNSNAVVVSSSAAPSASASVGARGAVQPYVSVHRHELALATTADASAPSSWLSPLTASATDVSKTFWKPSAERHEVGLLETLHKRTAANTSQLLVTTRPLEELRRNFSLPTGECINIDNDLFKLSKTTTTLRNMEQLDDGVNVDGKTLKSGMREHLAQLHQDDYYLVKYRDYSDWAIKYYSSIAKSDSLFGPKYVEKCFAIRVGQNPGAFIQITEPQLMFGWELLEAQKHTVTPQQISSRAVNLFALNADQFRALNTVNEPSVAAAGGHQSSPNPKQQASHQSHDASSSGYVAPSPWDWTPVAIEKRISHFMEQQYRSVGRMVVKTVVVGTCLYFFVQYVKRGTGLQSPQQSTSQVASGRRGSRRAPQVVDEGGSMIGAVASGVFSFLSGPKAMFDYMLGGV